MSVRGALVVGLVCVSLLPAIAQIRRADFVTLIGDTDEAIRFAKVIKELFATDPVARRALNQARDAVIQHWLEEKPATEFTEQERLAVRNPEYFDRAVLSAANVAFGVSPATVTLEWDVPPRLWPRIVAAIVPVAHRVARDGAFFSRKAVRLVMKLHGAEMYRANADLDGHVTTVFQYE